MDVTSDLVLRWGYRKTTLEDIARGAEVAKGTLFLHWPNREALFVSLLRRERVRTLTAVRRGLAPADARSGGPAEGTTSNPAEGTTSNLTEVPACASDTSALYPFLRQCVGEMLTRPLLRATLVGNEEMLGRLVRQERPASTSIGAIREFRQYLETLRVLGVVRTDLDLDELMGCCTSTLTGFLLSRDFPLPVAAAAQDSLSDERYAELGADTLWRILRPTNNVEGDNRGSRSGENAGGGDVEGEVTRATFDLVDRALSVAQEGYRVSLEQVGRSGD